MSKLVAIAAAAILAFVMPSPASAQAAVSEPGLASFYHPNADVLRAGPGAYGYGYGGPPAYGPAYEAQAYAGGPMVVAPTSRPVQHRSRLPQY